MNKARRIKRLHSVIRGVACISRFAGYFSPVNRPLEIATASVSDRSALFPRRATMDHISPDTVPTWPTSSLSPAVLSPFTCYRSFLFLFLSPVSGYLTINRMYRSEYPECESRAVTRVVVPRRQWEGGPIYFRNSFYSESVWPTTNAPATLKFNCSTNKYNPAKNFENYINKLR